MVVVVLPSPRALAVVVVVPALVVVLPSLELEVVDPDGDVVEPEEFELDDVLEEPELEFDEGVVVAFDEPVVVLPEEFEPEFDVLEEPELEFDGEVVFVVLPEEFKLDVMALPEEFDAFDEFCADANSQK